MDDGRLLTVKESQSARHVEHKLPDLLFWHLSDLTVDGAVGTIGHHQIRAVLVDIKVVDVQEVRMTQTVGNLEFIAEILNAFLIEGTVELDGHVDVCQHIVCQPYVTETAASELSQQLIVLRDDASFN